MAMTKATARRRDIFQEVIGIYQLRSRSYKENKDLAKAIGMSPSAFSQRWNFLVEWRLDEVSAICRVLHISDEDKAKLI